MRARPIMLLLGTLAGLLLVTCAGVYALLAPWPSAEDPKDQLSGSPVVEPSRARLDAVTHSAASRRDPDEQGQLETGSAEASAEYGANSPAMSSASNDSADAFRAFRHTVSCRQYLKYMLVASYIHPDTRVQFYGTERAETYLDNIEFALHVVSTRADECKDATWQRNNQRLFKTAFQASLQGDLDAQACFVAGDFFKLPTRYDASRNSRYKHYGLDFMKNVHAQFAPRFMRNGIHANYRPMLHLASSKLMANLDQNTWVQRLPMPDPREVYRGLLLMDYRLPSGQSERRLMEALGKKYSLSDRFKSKAETWARRKYRTDFINQPAPASRQSLGPCMSLGT